MTERCSFTGQLCVELVSCARRVSSPRTQRGASRRLTGAGVVLLLGAFVSCGGRATQHDSDRKDEASGGDTSVAASGGVTGDGDGDAPTGGKAGDGDGDGDGDATGSGGAMGGAPPDPWENLNWLPPDTRPVAPAWELPFDVGAPGWEDSVEPVCDPLQDSVSAQELWADERGVFLYVSSDCNVFANGQTCAATGTSVYQNTGSGWDLHYSSIVTGGRNLLGVTNGPLLPSSGVLAQLEMDGTAAAISPPTVLHAAVRGKDIYALILEETSEEKKLGLYLRSDDEWKLIREFDDPVYGLFAIEGGVLISMMDQVVFIDDDGSFTKVPDAPAGEYGNIWGTSPSAFWVAQYPNRILRYDGKWTVLHEVWAKEGASLQIELWGTSDKVFYVSPREFGVIDDQVEVIVDVPVEQRFGFDDLWGRSENEVFLTYTNAALSDYACGSLGVLWYDGEELHRF